jgi:hypothetical protein
MPARKWATIALCRKDLAQAATDYDLAQFKSNRADLERLLANDYILAGPTGRSQTKAEYLADALAPGSKTLAVALDIRVRKVWDTGAVLGGAVDARGLEGGKEFTFKGRFVVIASRSTLAPCLRCSGCSRP